MPTTTPQPSADNFPSTLSSNLAAADSTSATRVQNLALVHQARLSNLKRAATTASTRYGAKSAQATAAQAAVQTTTTTAARIALVHQQIATAPPQVTTTGWALYGIVTDSASNPVSGYAVFFVDAQNAYQREYGFAYTGSNGSYQIVFAGTSAASPEATPAAPAQTQELAAQNAAQDDAPAAGQQTQATAQPATPTLYVQVTNTDGKPVYLSKAAFTPALGKATAQNIKLAAGAPVIGTPPRVAKDTATPDIAKKS